MKRNNLLPTRKIRGFDVRPGLYELRGATALENAVNFTIHSSHATACSVVLFRRTEQKPYAVIPIPASFRIGDTWSIIIFGLDIYEFEYCYRLDGPYEPENGLIFDKSRNVLDIYAKAVTGQSVWGVKAKGDGSYHAGSGDIRAARQGVYKRLLVGGAVPGDVRRTYRKDTLS